MGSRSNMFTPEDTGNRLRSLRKTRGLSLRALAQKAGVAVSFLSRIESGNGSPTLATLLKLLEALDISAPDFFSTTATDNRHVVIQRHAEMKTLDDGDKLWRYLLPSHRHVKAVMTYEEYRPHTAHAEQEKHPHDLCAMVLSGTLTLAVADNAPAAVCAGDAFYIRAGTPHISSNQSDETLRMVVVELLNKPDPSA
jgi:transcriptional regulator with XRE-family HTH domain